MSSDLTFITNDQGKHLSEQFDQLVYALYGLTPEEIKIVEDAAK